MKSSTKNVPKSARDIAYYQQRYRNRVFSKLVSWIAEQAINNQLTKKDIADRINKDPALVTRLLSQPGNLTLDTISDLLLAFDAEAEPPDIILFKDRRPANYMHPLIARALNVNATTSAPKAESTGERKGVLSLSNPKPSVDIKVTATAS
jgi:hypothetical protein